MSKLQVPFETMPVTSPTGETIGYSMHICPQQILEDDAVYEEVIKEETLPLSVKLLKFCVNAVLAATARKVSQDCRPRRVGDEIKFAPFIRGKVSGPYSPFDEATCKTAVIPMPMKGVTKKIDLSRVLLVNTKGGLRVVIDRIVYEGCVDSSQIATIMRGKGIAVTGLNLQWLEGDSCTAVWKDAGGTEHSAPIVPTSSTVTEMHFAWPEALADVPAGSEVVMRFSTRGGIADAEPQLNEKTVTLIDGEVLPTVHKVATAGNDGIVKGEAFEATGENLGFNFTTDHVSVTWMQGGEQKQAAIVPLSATAEKIAFSTCSLFDALEDGTELTFTFEIGGKSAAKTTSLLAPKKRVVLSNGSVDGSAVFFEAENPEGIRDYVNDGITEEYSVDLWKNGTLVEAGAHAIHVLETGSPYVEYENFAEAGDTVKVVAHVNPAKTDFVQEDAVLEFTVE